MIEEPKMSIEFVWGLVSAPKKRKKKKKSQFDSFFYFNESHTQKKK